MKFNNKVSSIGIIITVILFLLSCSTNKNTSMRRGYHNLTAKFNVYFNGNDNFKKGLLKIDEASENYSQLLPIYKNENKEVAETATSDMDNAIKKAVKAIKTHSITVKPERKQSKSGKKGEKLSKEQEEFYQKSDYCNYIDDSYLLIGKAHYFKQDYQTAMKSLQLILNKFRKENSRFDAMYWIARTQSAAGDFKDALNYINLLKSDEKHPVKFDKEISLLMADLNIKQKEYQKGISNIDAVLKKSKRKKEKVRSIV